MGIKDFYRGDTKKYRLKIQDKTGSPISVDGGLLTVTFKRSIKDDDEDAALQVSQTGSETDPLAPEGIIEITLSHSHTNIAPATYFYDFQFVSDDGEVTTVLAGKVTVMADTTRSIS